MTLAPPPTPSPVAALAVELVRSGDLDVERLYARAIPSRGDDHGFPLFMARAELLGRLDARPGDVEVLTALGLLVAASSAGGWLSRDDVRSEDDDDELGAPRITTRRRRRHDP